MMAYILIGNTVIEWDDHWQLRFTMSEETGTRDDLRKTTYRFDLSGLQDGFEFNFLLSLKEIIVERRHRIALISVRTEYENILQLFSKILAWNLFDIKISVIDDGFLLALNTVTDKLSSVCLNTLKRLFNFNPHSPIFAKQLRGVDFPLKSNKKGNFGNTISNILATALTRSACVEILRRCEEAYEDDVIDIGLFSFINLAFAVYVRPDSYRRIRLCDLVYDKESNSYFLFIPPAKTGEAAPQKVPCRINKNVGTLLLKQRQQVITNCGHLVDSKNIGKLALFPSRKLKFDKSGVTCWASKHANQHFGEISGGCTFSDVYFRQIKNLVLNGENGVNARSLRHTVGTQLAELGCSAKTIQAVLKHAGDQTCMAYVDIAFHGLINDLSDAMRPAFEACLPVFQRFRSKEISITTNKAIISEDINTGRIELTGECGKQIRCHAAPFTCYECNKFIACFDADHSINLDIIQREIDCYKSAGTPYKHLVEKAKSIKYRIQLVIASCDRYQQTLAEQKGDYGQSRSF